LIADGTDAMHCWDNHTTAIGMWQLKQLISATLKISPRYQPIHGRKHMHHTYYGEMAATKSTKRHQNLTWKTPNRGKPRDQPSQVFFHYYTCGNTTSSSLDSTRGSHISIFINLG
jgi:hypothetical protein